MLTRNMISKVFLLLFVLTLFVVQSNAAVGERRDRSTREFTGGTGWGSTREEILENRKRRKRQLRNMIHAMRKKLADHSAGEITLNPQEKADTERRLDLYSRKLDMLKQELGEEDFERIIERTESQQRRRQAAQRTVIPNKPTSTSYDEL